MQLKRLLMNQYATERHFVVFNLRTVKTLHFEFPSHLIIGNKMFSIYRSINFIGLKILQIKEKEKDQKGIARTGK